MVKAGLSQGPHPGLDSAVLLFQTGEFEFPETLIHLRPPKDFINLGNEVGWLGYPGLYPLTLCFFSGCVSARRKNAYLIDGVAINGVSGGPVVYSPDGAGVEFVGAISAYHANRQGGGTLPGLLVAQDVSHFHTAIQVFKSLDELRKKKQEEEAAKAVPADNPPNPSGEPLPQPQ